MGWVLGALVVFWLFDHAEGPLWLLSLIAVACLAIVFVPAIIAMPIPFAILAGLYLLGDE